MSSTNEPMQETILAYQAEIETDPKAFFARTDEIETDLGARKWAQAKWLHDKWNPHNEEVPKGRGGRTPRDGITQKRLGEMIGRNQSAVGQMIQAYRQCYGTGITFSEALAIATHGSVESRATSHQRATGRSALREQPVAMAQDIAKALENPQVAEAVQAAIDAKEDTPGRLAAAVVQPASSRVVNGPAETPTSPSPMSPALVDRVAERPESGDQDNGETPPGSYTAEDLAEWKAERELKSRSQAIGKQLTIAHKALLAATSFIEKSPDLTLEQQELIEKGIAGVRASLESAEAAFAQVRKAAA